MIRVRAILLAGAAAGFAALVACASYSNADAEAEPADAPPAETAASLDDPDACGASDYQALIGSNIAAADLPTDMNVRILRPGAIATMDYRPDRLNVLLDEDGVITRVRCG